jgi:hypothetical protein
VLEGQEKLLPEIDLEPGSYREKGAKEPILAKGWWIGVLLILLIFAMAFARRLVVG